MKIGRDEIEARMRRLRRVFKEAGVKMTHQRLEIFQEVAGTGEHPDAVTIYRRVRRRMPTISLDTVYRTLWMLVDMGLITTMGIHHVRARFDANTATHHHFVCTGCGMAEDLDSRDLNGLQAPKEVKRLGRVDTTHVEFRGLCSRCSKATKQSRNRKRPV
jgi:Fur family peroxide stress response transcriptional regulator